MCNIEQIKCNIYISLSGEAQFLVTKLKVDCVIVFLQISSVVKFFKSFVA